MKSMKFNMYATIAIFIGIIVVTWIIAAQHPVRTVKYENGTVIEDKK